MATAARESLTCPRCNHELASDKTVGRSGDVTVTCAKCKEASALGAWRAAFSRSVPPHRKPNHDSDWGSLSGVTYALVLCAMSLLLLVSVLAMAASLVPDPYFRDRFNENVAPGATANALERIQRDIQVIRTTVTFVGSLISAWISARASRWAWNGLSRTSKSDPSPIHPIL